ncbi:MAG TPA: hypothetical protein VGA21_09020 [Cyclobacteriaceae bacterium]
MKRSRLISDKLIIALEFVFFLLLLISASSLLQSCEDKCETVTSYIMMEPVYKTTEEVRNGFGIKEPHPIESSGKIYVFGEYLLVNEPGNGIHIIRNADCNPIPVSFIAIPGNFDMAVKDYILYADSYVDLLAIDISNLPEITLIKRLENAFPNYNYEWGVGYGGIDNLIVTHFEEKEIVDIQTDCNNRANFWERNVLFIGSCVNCSAPQLAGNTPSGVGGSMARFAVSGENLYAVDFNSLRVFDISTQTDPQAGNVVEIGWGIETIFPYKDNLFIGSNSGMFIFDNSDPTSPYLKSQFKHVRTCDPVVVDDRYAYVTLRSGSECEGFTNQLDVLDIADLSNPFLLKTYPMQNPHGLSIDGDILFITEGDFGMKVFNAADRNDIDNHLLDAITNVHGFDVIAFNQKAILIGEDGLYIYNYSDPTNLETCGFISVGEK